jgi:xylulokinase
VLAGLTHDSDAAAIGQAVLEGVALAFRDGLDALTRGGAAIDAISVIGGGTRSAYWGRILASALARPLVYRDGGNVGAALGAARLAMLAHGAGSEAQVCAAPAVLAVVPPDARLADDLAAKAVRFRALYPAIKRVFQEDSR